MPYREKIAWLSLVAMTVTFGPYFAIVAAGTFDGAPLPNFPQLKGYAVTTIVQLLILAAGHLYLRRKSPEDAQLPADERDRAIKYRSLTSAYFVLLAGTILVGCIMPFYASGWTLVNAAVFMIVAAEMVHYAVVVLSYRGQA